MKIYEVTAIYTIQANDENGAKSLLGEFLSDPDGFDKFERMKGNIKIKGAREIKGTKATNLKTPKWGLYKQ